MLELAIAEAYRPRPGPRPAQNAPPRPATFATNPNARSSTSSFRSRLLSVPSRSPSVTSHSLTFRSLIPGRKRPDSVLSARTFKLHDTNTYPSDSVLNRASVTLAALESGKPEPGPVTHAAPPYKHTDRTIPVLPPIVPLPPQEELSHFDSALDHAISSLHPSSPLHQDPALTVLQHLAHISNLASCVAICWPEFWALLLHAANLIASVLPTGDIGARNVLVASLAGVAERWNAEEERSTVEIAGIVGGVFDEVVQKRGTVDERVGKEVALWVCGYCRGIRRERGNAVRILMRGVSRAVLAALECALASDADLEIHLFVLSSLDQGLPPPPSYSRLKISTYSGSAVGTASQGVDALLLDFSCLDTAGDVRCQNDALGTAVCVKTLSPSAKVVALGGVDNIALAVLERRATGENVGGIDETHEPVPANFVDVYVTETGVMRVEDLRRVAMDAEELDRHILGGKGY